MNPLVVALDAVRLALASVEAKPIAVGPAAAYWSDARSHLVAARGAIEAALSAWNGQADPGSS